MNKNKNIISPCVDVVLHGICNHNTIEPKIGQEFTIEGITFACKRATSPRDMTSCAEECDMPQNLCTYMNCCFYSRTDRTNVTFSKLS